jgi:hypothetical protein
MHDEMVFEMQIGLPHTPFFYRKEDLKMRNTTKCMNMNIPNADKIKAQLQT